jgi:hypothetical protein
METEESDKGVVDLQDPSRRGGEHARYLHSDEGGGAGSLIGDYFIDMAEVAHESPDSLYSFPLLCVRLPGKTEEDVPVASLLLRDGSGVDLPGLGAGEKLADLLSIPADHPGERRRGQLPARFEKFHTLLTVTVEKRVGNYGYRMLLEKGKKRIRCKVRVRKKQTCGAVLMEKGEPAGHQDLFRRLPDATKHVMG